HQKTFASAYATPHINTTRRLGLAEKTPEGLTQLLLIGNQFVSKHLQACDGPLLGLVGPIATLGKGLFVILQYVHEAGRFESIRMDGRSCRGAMARPAFDGRRRAPYCRNRPGCRWHPGLSDRERSG